MPFTEANGISIHYKLAGELGPVVVLLHEMGGTLESWDQVAPGLSDRFRVLRYDQRGAGLTEKPRRSWTNDELVGDIEGLVKALDLPPPYSLVSVAAAGTQSLGFMLKHPDQVKALVLCNPALGVPPARAGALNDRAAQAERDGMRGVLPITLDLSYPPEQTDRATYEAYRGRYLASDPVGFANQNRVLAQTYLVDALPQIKCPTMVVAGKHDKVRPAAGSEEIAGKIAGARFELIEAGHFMPTTGPAPLLELLREFLPE